MLGDGDGRGSFVSQAERAQQQVHLVVWVAGPHGEVVARLVGEFGLRGEVEVEVEAGGGAEKLAGADDAQRSHGGALRAREEVRVRLAVVQVDSAPAIRLPSAWECTAGRFR